jgi:hypothetical protein
VVAAAVTPRAAAVRSARVSRRLVTVWTLFAVLVGVAFVIESTDVVTPRPGAAGKPDATMLLPVPVDQLGAIELADAGTLYRFERDASGAWLYHGTHSASEPAHSHTADPALSQQIAKALAAFGRTRVEREVPRDGDGRTYGLTAPRMVILAYRPRETQPIAQYAVGDLAPDTVSRYVDVVGARGVVTIPSYQIDNLATLIEAVKATPPPAPAR